MKISFVMDKNDELNKELKNLIKPYVKSEVRNIIREIISEEIQKKLETVDVSFYFKEYFISKINNNNDIVFKLLDDFCKNHEKEIIKAIGNRVERVLSNNFKDELLKKIRKSLN